jgi:multicomponent K+:H+ antiporter subunit E
MTDTKTRWFPAPIVSLCVFVVWLLLNNTVFVGHVLLAFLLAWLMPFICIAQDEAAIPLRKPKTFVRLMLIVLYDIVISNLQVARLIVGRERNINPSFLWVPLDIETDAAKLWLAGIITMTPGTVSALFSDDRRHLLVHSLNVDDVPAMVQGIKDRYEAPLKEIFG